MKKVGIVIGCCILMMTIVGCNSAFGESQENKTSMEETVLEGTSDLVTETGLGDTTADEKNKFADTDYIEYEKNYVYLCESDEETYQTIASGDYQTLTVQSANAIRLKGSILSVVEKREQEIKEAYDLNLQCAKENPQYNEYSEIVPYEIHSSLLVKRADGKVFSFLENYENSCKTLYQQCCSYGYNFDTNTGGVLTIDDVVTDTSLLTNMIEQKLIAKYGTEIFNKEDLSNFIYTAYFDKNAQEKLPLSFTIGQEGISIYFSSNELTNQQGGLMEISILYEDEPQMFNENYLPAKENDYIVEIIGTDEDFIDIDHNGMQDLIVVKANYDEYNCIESFQIKVNENEILLEVHAFDYETCFVNTTHGKYLYITVTEENDYHTVSVVDITTMVPSYVSTFEGEIQNFVNPNAYFVRRKVDVLSSYGGSILCYTAEDGSICESEDFYRVDSETVLKTVIELEGELVEKSDFTGTGNKEVVPAGCELKMIRTDAANYVIMETDEGKLIRFEVSTEWPQTINGIDAESCFEQMYFAG